MFFFCVPRRNKSISYKLSSHQSSFWRLHFIHSTHRKKNHIEPFLLHPKKTLKPHGPRRPRTFHKRAPPRLPLSSPDISRELLGQKPAFGVQIDLAVSAICWVPPDFSWISGWRFGVFRWGRKLNSNSTRMIFHSAIRLMRILPKIHLKWTVGLEQIVIFDRIPWDSTHFCN